MINQRLLLDRNIKNIKLEVPLKCTICGGFDITKCINPEEHDAIIEELDLRVKNLSWMRINQIRSESYIINQSTQMSQFSVSNYTSAMLKELVVDAPWGETTDIFLTTIGPELGAALTTLLPNIDDSDDISKNIDTIKKGAGNSLAEGE